LESEGTLIFLGCFTHKRTNQRRGRKKGGDHAPQWFLRSHQLCLTQEAYMTFSLKVLGTLTAAMFLTTGLAIAGPEKDPLPARVPADKRAAAKKDKSPLYDKAEDAKAEIVAEGKSLYLGKGTCINCHGEKGDGQGPAGAVLNPGPRNFTNCKFHKKRKDGELMWVIKNGSPGTGMVPLVPATISEEEAWKIIAYERSFCKG
jgi:mono/diheme cytochrome c family protein